jgi:thioredoxin 2
MADALHIVCPHCDAINRVPRERLRDGAKCGSAIGGFLKGGWPR